MRLRVLPLVLSVAAQALLAPPGYAQAGAPPDVDGIIARYVDARGGLPAIRTIETLSYSHGTYSEGDFVGSGRSRMAFRRPYYRIVGDPADPSRFMEGFDGGSWEWYPDPGIVIRTIGPASGATRRGADFEGGLIDYRAKGSSVVLQGVEQVDGRPAYRLALTTRDGFRRDYLIDVETSLVVAERHVAPVHAFGDAVTSETRIGDYRPVAGVLFAHRFREVEVGTGRLLSEMQWGVIEANVDLPIDSFSPPAVSRGPLQKMLEAVYAARTDSQAALWSYEAFLRGYPDVDERAGVEMVAYQMLKMRDANETAVRLLERNARRHPESSSATFSLGRAFETIGFPETAAEAYRRALSLDPENRSAREGLERLGGR